MRKRHRVDVFFARVRITQTLIRAEFSELDGDSVGDSIWFLKVYEFIFMITNGTALPDDANSTKYEQRDVSLDRTAKWLQETSKTTQVSVKAVLNSRLGVKVV